MEYNWIYTTSNDNIYILVLVIIILFFIIIDFELWKKKSDRFYDVPNITIQPTLPQILPNMQSNATMQQQKPTESSIPTIYQPPMMDNPMNPNFYISKEEIERRNAWSQLDGNEESLANTNGSKSDLPKYQNDITQSNSTLYNNSNTQSQAINYATVGDYATLDSLGSMMTDTLGGIKTNIGYTILEDRLGTFNNYSNNNTNPHTYDNTANYKTGLNPSTVDGANLGMSSGYGSNGQYTQNNKPIFLQKDFQGVANIFAPNIIISNPPLMSDGNPDISFQM